MANKTYKSGNQTWFRPTGVKEDSRDRCNVSRDRGMRIGRAVVSIGSPGFRG